MRRKRILACVLAALPCLLFFLSGCSHKVEADISAYEDTEIKVVGIWEEPRIFTTSDLAGLKCTAKTITAETGKKKVKIRAAGPALDTFLENCGVSWEQLDRIVFTAGDGYRKEFTGSFFQVHPDAVLAVADGKNPLKEEEQPVRLVISGTTPDFWVRNVVEIRIERKET